MGAKKILFMDILRIMTLEEIGELITKHEGEISSSLTERLEAEMNVSPAAVASNPDGAKILAFPGTELPAAIEQEPNAADVAQAAQAQDEQSLESLNTGGFILQQKKRLESNQKKLKSREVFKLYQQEAQVNLDAEKKHSQDLKKSIDVGVLVDKKQF